MDFLTKILEEKNKEVKTLKDNFSFEYTDRKKRSFVEKVKANNNLAIIAEIKRGSPSKGMINADLSPVEQAKKYERFGATAISVLTDQKFFYGSFDFLKQVREAVDLPLLCKDFIISRIQVQKAYDCGADMYLLIAAALDDATLSKLYNYGKGLGLEPLVEVHNEVELDRVLKLGVEIIGINNRDLRTFKVDINTTIKLSKKIGKDKIIISESGITGAEEIKRLKDTGVRGVLVGEAFVRAENLKAKFDEIREL